MTSVKDVHTLDLDRDAAGPTIELQSAVFGRQGGA